MSIRSQVKYGAVAAALLGTFAGVAVPASAATNNAIGGTAYSGCSFNGPWYESQNARTKSGSGPVRLEFSQVNSSGIQWKLLGKSNQQYGSEQSWGSNETGEWRTLVGNLGAGTTFFNEYRDQDYSCPSHQSTYEFKGTEYY